MPARVVSPAQIFGSGCVPSTRSAGHDMAWLPCRIACSLSAVPASLVLALARIRVHSLSCGRDLGLPAREDRPVPAEEVEPLRAEPFPVRIDPGVVDDLRARIRNARLPERAPGGPWEQGTDRDYIEGVDRVLGGGVRLAGSRARAELFRPVPGRDWRDRDSFRARAGPWRRGDPAGSGSWLAELLHRVAAAGPAADRPCGGWHRRAGVRRGDPLPSWLWLLRTASCGRRGDLPLRGRAVAPAHARSWLHSLRGGRRRLRFGYRDVHGSGRSRAAHRPASDEPGARPLYRARSRPLSEREKGYLEQSQRWDQTERGYTAIQSTRPQTLGYALNDSPAGLAAWILEKWRSWSDCGGDLESRFSRDFLLSVVTLSWVTGSITSSMCDYYDNRRWQGEPRLGPGDTVRVPTAVAVFPPRSQSSLPATSPHSSPHSTVKSLAAATASACRTTNLGGPAAGCPHTAIAP